MGAVQPRPGAGVRPRLESIDLVRGAVMVLMALDHARDFFHGPYTYSPTDLSRASAALFATRWITHFCAPVFVLLAGTSAYLRRARGARTSELPGFLLRRGLWLVVLELTVVHLAWTYDVRFRWNLAQVLWAIGWSMVALAGLVRLRVPTWAIGSLGLATIAGHNALDGIAWDHWAWTVLHVARDIEFAPGHHLYVAYPLVPWVGVLATGYALGPLFLAEARSRRRALIALGLLCLGAFVLLRAPNLYGDPEPWARAATPLGTAFSFVNCEKYPPSLQYLLVTLGPAFLALAALDRASPSPSHPLRVFGRVPLFYYLVHLPLLGLAAIACHYARHGERLLEIGPENLPDDLGFPLWTAWLACAAAVAVLHPVCRRFDQAKSARPGSWLRYL